MNQPRTPHHLTRRRFVLGSAAGAGLLAAGAGRAQAGRPPAGPALHGRAFDLHVGYHAVNITGANRTATLMNGALPAPVLHWREGETVTIRVHNHLAEDTSIHWHGMILPTHMDGVPGLSFPGIRPGETFTYRFPVQQSGTYWYHSHSGFQEQTGHYGAIVIHPREPDPVPTERDYVVLLSDWTDEDPDDVYRTLKKVSHFYNTRERTADDLWQQIRAQGVTATWRDRAMWNRMRMSDRDISDVTGMTYTFLMNGQPPARGWTALFRRGEKVRLRFINAAAMTLFDLRLPGLKMKVVAADGQYVEPFSVDDLRIGVAETYDVVVEPAADTAYSIFAQAIDRSGFALGTLTPDPSLRAEPPPMDHPPVLGHADMGMRMDHGGSADHGGMDHAMHGGHAGHAMPAPPAEPAHAASEFGPQVDMRAERAPDGADDPGIGLRDHRRRYGRRVLRYADLCHLGTAPDCRDPDREIELHLTGNMARYMWSIDGIPFADAEPLLFRYGERLRVTLVNDTMMTHPVHLHGMWSDIENGMNGDRLPRKHTLLVQPGRRISYRVSVDARGRWAYHCHLLYHMPGMFREVRV